MLNLLWIVDGWAGGGPGHRPGVLVLERKWRTNPLPSSIPSIGTSCLDAYPTQDGRAVQLAVRLRTSTASVRRRRSLLLVAVDPHSHVPHSAVLRARPPSVDRLACSAVQYVPADGTTSHAAQCMCVGCAVASHMHCAAVVQCVGMWAAVATIPLTHCSCTQCTALYGVQGCACGTRAARDWAARSATVSLAGR